MAEGAMKVNDGNFEAEIEQFQGVALVDMGASWCPPCKMLAPIIEQVAEEAGEGARVATLDVDESRKTASRFNVLNVPTMIFFKNGKEAARMVGVSPKEKILAQIEALSG